MRAEEKQRFGLHMGRGEWGHLVHTWHRGEPNHGLTEILTNGEWAGGWGLSLG